MGDGTERGKTHFNKPRVLNPTLDPEKCGLRPFDRKFFGIFLASPSRSALSRGGQRWTGTYTLVVPSLSTKFIKNSHQNLPVQPIFRDRACHAV